jgi:hypothetical protein
MIHRASVALHEAVALLRAPRGRRPSPEERLPEGMSLLLRLVCGEEDALSTAQTATRETPETLREAAIFYIQQVCFAPGSSSYRVLGVDPDASDEKIREHYRWLARWLHPDRNPDPWEVVFAERVGQAWQQLRTAERRQRHDAVVVDSTDDWSSVVAAAPIPRPVAAAPAAPATPEAVGTKAPPPRGYRWLPAAAIAGLGATALGVVVLNFTAKPSLSSQTGPSALATESPAASDVTPTRRPEILAQAPAVAPMETAAVPEANPVAPPPLMAATELPIVSAPASPTPVPMPVSTPPAIPVARTRPSPPPRVVAIEARAEPVEAAHRDTQSRVDISPETTPAPAAAALAEVARQSASPTVGIRDANRLLGHFSRAFEAGDLQGMRELFAADARGPRGGLDSIIADYGQVFSDSRQRSLSVRDVNWFLLGDTFTIIASFEATVTKGRTGRSRRSHGDLRLDLRREGEKWRIYRMQHDENPG